MGMFTGTDSAMSARLCEYAYLFIFVYKFLQVCLDCTTLDTTLMYLNFGVNPKDFQELWEIFGRF